MSARTCCFGEASHRPHRRGSIGMDIEAKGESSCLSSLDGPPRTVAARNIQTLVRFEFAAKDRPVGVSVPRLVESRVS